MATIFSDSWFRVADLRVALLPSVEITVHQFRGRTWHVLQDPYTQRFFRSSVQASRFIQNLRPDKSVEEVWDDYVNDHPQDAPSREEVIQLLSQLHVSNLLYSLEQSDSQAIVARYKSQKNKELISKLASFLFVRIPLFNPNAMLDRIRPLVLALTGWSAFVVWCVILLSGGWALFNNWGALVDQSEGVLSVGNLPWLYVCLVSLKIFHEAGHAFVCKRFGGEVRTVGVMFLILTPLPYVDASSSWGFTNRWHRIYTTFAGMAVEFFFAALGALVWANTGPGLMHSLAFNVMLIGSVSSVLFNGNPLLRFDAYYMLSDYAEIPNLYQKSQQQWKYFGDRYFLGTITAKSKASDRKEWFWLTLYGFLSLIYMLLITLGIGLFLMDQWLPLGLLVLAMSLYSRLISPLFQLFKHLRSAATQGNRRRAVASVMALTLWVLVLFGLVPFPDATRIQGIIKANHATNMYVLTTGLLDSMLVSHGQRVHAGQVLARFSNLDLAAEVYLSQLGLLEVQAQIRQALHHNQTDLSALQEKASALELRLTNLLEQQAQLVVRAPHDGEWIAPDLHEAQGSWMQRGTSLGEVVDASSFRFVAVVPQAQADRMFQDDLHNAQLRLSSHLDSELSLGPVKIIPFQSEKLPSTALGWLGGGEIAVNTQDASGTQAIESFFLLQVALPAAPATNMHLLHGLTGTLRLQNKASPLASQGYKAVKQLVQKRYAL